MSFDAEIGDLRTSAQAARSAADQTGALDPAEALRSASGGLPGSAAAAVLGQVAARWDAERTRWATRARGYAADLDAAATRYAAADGAARDAFLAAPQRPR